MALKLRSEKNLLRINQLSLWKRQSYLNVPPRFRWPFKKAHAISQPPRGPQTRFSHPSCYLAGTNDCSERISREHYMSKSVLDQLGNTLRVTGMPLLKPGFYGRPILTVATVPAQAAKVCELGAMHRAQTRNLGAPIRAKEHAASATGTPP